MVRRVLLEADVSLPVVQLFIKRVRAKAEGTKVLKSIQPGEQFIHIINNELVKLLGKDIASLTKTSSPTIVLLAGLQGSGKTTTCAKLAKKLLKNGAGNKDKKSEVVAKQKYILSITENGFGKRTSFYEYRVTNRGGKGIIGIINSSRNGNVAASLPVNEGDEIILSTDKGRVIRCAVKEIRSAGRNTQGVRIFKLSGEEKVVSAIKVEDE